MKVAIGIPAYNEEKNIAKIITLLQRKFDTIIVCNDGSKDLTGEIAEKMGVLVINHKKNLGYGGSIRSLFLKAKEMELDTLITFDGDGQHRTEDIDIVLEHIKNNDADIVIGSRFINEKNSQNIPKYRKIGIKVITKISNLSSKSNLTDSQSGFRAYNKKALEKITPSDFGMGVSTEILIKAVKAELRIIEVPITISYEGDTSTHNAVLHGTSVIMSTMKFVSIEHPLKFYGIPGLVFLFIGLFFVVWTIQEFSVSRQIITNISLIGIGSTIIGMIFLLNAIILYSIVSVVREQQSN